MPGQQIPFPYIEGLNPQQQEQLYRDFEAVLAQINAAQGILYIAPADASVWDKQHADLVLTGVSDELAINQLLVQHSLDYLVYAFFEGNVSCTGTINPDANPADWIGLSRPIILSEDSDHLDAFDDIERGTNITFATGGTYTTVQTIDPSNVVSCMFSMQQGSIKNLRLTGDASSVVGCITELNHYGAFGASVHLEDLWLANVNFLVGGGKGFHCVFRNIINTTPEEGISA